jgi:type II secretory pathway component PulK
LLYELAGLSDDFFVKLQDSRLTRQREQYEKLKPVGFEYASEKAKKYRKDLESSDDVEQMKHLQKILVYNDDKKTVTFPDIDETFCVEL